MDVKGLLMIHCTVRGTVLAGSHYYIDHDRCRQPYLLIPEVVSGTEDVVDVLKAAVGRKVCVRCRGYCYY